MLWSWLKFAATSSSPTSTVLAPVYWTSCSRWCRSRECFSFVDMADKILGVNLATTFKNRNDFSSDSEYQYYIKTNLRPNILCCARKTQRGTWWTREPLVRWSASTWAGPWSSGRPATLSQSPFSTSTSSPLLSTLSHWQRYCRLDSTRSRKLSEITSELVDLFLNLYQISGNIFEGIFWE